MCMVDAVILKYPYLVLDVGLSLLAEEVPTSTSHLGQTNS